MDYFSIIDNLTGYGADIAVISLVTCIIVQVLKRTLLKDCPKKVISFLPFVVGTVLYAVFAAVAHLDISYLLTDLPYVCGRGLTIGAIATALYVLYEQLIRERESANMTEGIIAAIIEGYVPDDKTAEAAGGVAEAIASDLTGNGADIAAQIIKKYAADGVGDVEIEALSKLIIETLKSLSITMQ